MALKHVGRIKRNQRKVIVAYRTVPNEPENCIVVTTENLEADSHDSLMKLVESDAGQHANELAEAMARARLPDGRIMLSAFHTTGKMIKLSTAEVEMTPDRHTTIMLDELNKVIADQKGVTLEELSLQAPASTETPTEAPATAETEVETLATAQTIPAPNDGVLSDEDLAAQYRSQADALFKEAKSLREQAEALVPTKKRAKKPESA